MKKRLLLSIAAAVIALGASAQNKAIEALAKKYSDRDGFSTTVVKGAISTGIAGSLNIESVDISNFIKDISSIIVIRAEKPDKDFSNEVNSAVAQGYTTILSSSTDGEHVRFLLSENAGGRKNEFVIVIFGKETNLLVSIVGNYTLKKVSKSN